MFVRTDVPHPCGPPAEANHVWPILVVEKSDQEQEAAATATAAGKLHRRRRLSMRGPGTPGPAGDRPRHALCRPTVSIESDHTGDVIWRRRQAIHVHSA